MTTTNQSLPNKLKKCYLHQFIIYLKPKTHLNLIKVSNLESNSKNYNKQWVLTVHYVANSQQLQGYIALAHTEVKKNLPFVFTLFRVYNIHFNMNYKGNLTNNAHYFLRICIFYFRKYLVTILLCSPPASQSQCPNVSEHLLLHLGYHFCSVLGWLR
jgi:hypothetical protein